MVLFNVRTKVTATKDKTYRQPTQQPQLSRKIVSLDDFVSNR